MLKLQFTTIVSFLVLSLKASAWSPTDSYAPAEVDCPSYLDEDDYNTDHVKGLTRAANTLSSDEKSWMESRDEITIENLKWYLNLANMTDFNTDDYIANITDSNNTYIPRIAIAFSGGGYRAMLTAAGEISGLDNRTDGCYEHGVPILQAASYVAGLSGGSWFLSTLAFNNWTSVQEIINQNGQDDAIWDLENSIFSPGGYNIFSTAGYWDDIGDDISAKRDAGFEISLTDPWGRALSHQFFPDSSDYGASMTFTSIRDFPVFANHEMPFPIVVSDGRAPGTTILNLNSTVFEFTPFELGSWDPSLYAFTDLKYVGTNVTGGVPDDTCIAGLDNTGYVFGTSSTLFNQVIMNLNTTDLPSVISNLLEDFLNKLGEDEDDIAEYYPNPFYKSEWADLETIVEDTSLYLVDGGEDLQNIPLQPLIQAEREIDVIFAYDNSYDTNAIWPNGTSLVYTYERQFGSQGNGTAFPYVPDQASFVNLNLTAKPTFFGCYSSNLTSLMEEVGASYVPPLVVYTANRPFSFYSNVSTYQMSYEDEDKLSIIQNGFAVTTRNNLTLDDEFRACVGCAILQRSRERLGMPIGDQCQSCFDEYCWDGSLDSDTSDVPVNYTETGMTNEAEATNNTSGAFSLFMDKSSNMCGMLVSLLVVCLVGL